jgi:hypothetical protein
VPYILIQVNKNIAKFFTLMVKGPFEQIYGLNAIHTSSSWDICIHHET